MAFSSNRSLFMETYPSRFETIYGENIGESFYAADTGRAAPPPAAQT